MVDDAAGPLALGAKGSVRDRLTPPGRVEGSALGRYIVSLRWRGMALSAPFFMPPLAAKTFTTALTGAGNAFPPLVAGATTFPPQAGALWMLSHGAMSLQESMEQFILSPRMGESPAQPDKGEPRSG